MGTIKTGQVIEADDLLNNMIGLQFKNYANVIYNADLIGFNSGLVEDWKDLKYDTLEDSSGIGGTSNTNICDTPVFPAEIIDDFESGSIDETNIWTKTTTLQDWAITEEDGDRYLSYLYTISGSTASGYLLNDGGTSGTGQNMNTQNERAYLRVSHTGVGASYTQIQIVDESSNEVTIWGASGTGNGTWNVSLLMDPNNNKIKRYAATANKNLLSSWPESPSWTEVDVSSLNDGEEWYIRLRSATNTWIHSKFYFVRYIDNAAVTKDFISTVTTSSETINNAILVATDDTTSGNLTYYLSADNGNNYEEVTLNEIHRFTNTGTQLIVKVSMTSTTSSFPILQHYAVQYNIGGGSA
jgi:hypothetical protein